MRDLQQLRIEVAACGCCENLDPISLGAPPDNPRRSCPPCLSTLWKGLVAGERIQHEHVASVGAFQDRAPPLNRKIYRPTAARQMAMARHEAAQPGR
jgi:hypothetical protein